MTPACHKCGEGIHNLDDAYQRVTGYTKRRDQGGANTVFLRQSEPVWLCMHCMNKARAGLNPLQGSLG